MHFKLGHTCPVVSLQGLTGHINTYLVSIGRGDQSKKIKFGISVLIRVNLVYRYTSRNSVGPVLHDTYLG